MQTGAGYVEMMCDPGSTDKHMSFSLTNARSARANHSPTRAEMDAKIAADRGLAPAARKAREDALRARIEAEIEEAQLKGVRGHAPDRPGRIRRL